MITGQFSGVVFGL